MFDCSEHHEVEELLSRSENHLWRRLCAGHAAERLHAPGVSVLEPRPSGWTSRTDVGEGSNWSARMEKGSVLDRGEVKEDFRI